MKKHKIVPIKGNWDISKWESKKPQITYLAPYEEPLDGTDPRNVALALFEGEMKRGFIKTKVRFAKEGSRIARIVIGYDSVTEGYYSVGIGGYGIAYLIDRYDEGVGWHAIASKGKREQIKRERTYQIEVRLDGQRLILKVDNTELFRYLLPAKNLGKQIGLFSWGKGNVTFSDITITVDNPKAFVIMKFDDVFESIYKKIIEPICLKWGLDPYTAGDVYRPGLIMEDIIRGIEESEFLIADITPVPHNENVYYEIGYAHALRKKIILLAKRGSQLPFDISGYRVIFYDDISIRGKKKVEKKFDNFLASILS